MELLVDWSRKRTWTDVQLRAAIANSTNFREVADELRVYSPDSLRRRAAKLGIDISHFVPRRLRQRRWTNADLRTAVRGARSISDVLRALGLVPAGGNYDHVQRTIAALGLDTSHFRHVPWNLGLRLPARAIPLETVLVAGRWTPTHRLKLRLIRSGLKEARCELCGWAERAPGGRIPLELDHINGDRNDNRLVNLRVVCPNCHALQPTHRGLNRRDRRR